MDLGHDERTGMLNEIGTEAKLISLGNVILCFLFNGLFLDAAVE